jgi:hypothetical protein
MFHKENNMAASNDANLIVTAFWEVNPGEEAAVAGLLKDFLPQAQQEPGVKEFQIHQNLSKPQEFSFTRCSREKPRSPSISRPSTSRTSSSARPFPGSQSASGRSSGLSDEHSANSVAPL